MAGSKTSTASSPAGHPIGKRVLITGGSGYLGQFLVQAVAKAQYQVHYTHHSSPAPPFPGSDYVQTHADPAAPPFTGYVQPFQVDLVSGKGLRRCVSGRGPLHAVVNTAAISSPAACEKDPAAARAVNVPSKLLDELDAHVAKHGTRPLLIHLSTDQVYDGSRADWREDEAGNPVNAYGKSKLEAERVIQERWPKHVILRSSIIYGRHPLQAVPRPLFLEFVEERLCDGIPTQFFIDEFRNPVYVRDIEAVVLKLLAEPLELPRRVFNMGGPERLSRVDIAHKVAEEYDYLPDAIIPAPSSAVNRGVASPADISMVSRPLEEALGMRFTPFSEGLAHMIHED